MLLLKFVASCRETLRVIDQGYQLSKGTAAVKNKPKPPVWVASEFQAQSSPNKPHVRLPPPRPKDPSTVRVITKPISEFTDPSAPSDPKPKKQIAAKPFSVQPVPAFLPQTPKDESVHRPHDLTLFRIQTPIFQTNNPPWTVPSEALRDIAPMPPPPRIEPKMAATPAPVVTVTDRDYVPLTDLTTPRVFEYPNTVASKGRMPKGDDDLPISEDPPAEETMRTAEVTPNEAEAFEMKDLSFGLDLDTTCACVRGGLAARALMVITQRDKDDALWHHYQTAKLSKNLNTREDLRVHVVQVLQPVGEPVLVRCAAQSSSTDGGNPTSTNLVDVLLSQPGMRKGLPVIEPSAVIRLWKPWIEINLEATSRPLPAPLEGKLGDKHPGTHAVADEGADDTEQRPLALPRHFEDWRPYGENLAPDRRARSALLCSRFVVG